MGFFAVVVGGGFVGFVVGGGVFVGGGDGERAGEGGGWEVVDVIAGGGGGGDFEAFVFVGHGYLRGVVDVVDFDGGFGLWGFWVEVRVRSKFGLGGEGECRSCPDLQRLHSPDFDRDRLQRMPSWA